MNFTNSRESLYHGTDSKYSKMKQLVLGIGEYLKTRSDDVSSGLNRNLQALALTIDLSIFDPHTNIAAEFFVSLYELMNRTEPRSTFAWHCVDILSNACKNPAARYALIHTYQFIPSLSRMLSDQLTVAKKIRLLKLMQDLSCGIRISWQIPHLQHLMSTLTKWVESQNESIVTLSLGVLVNLCYKNLPAIYTLSRHVDIKRFFRVCLPLQGPIIEVYTCKLLIILDHMNGDIPKEIILKLIDVTFKSVCEAFKTRDVILLRQIVEFFLDVRTQTKEMEYLKSYKHYEEQLQILLKVLESNSPADSGDSGLTISSGDDPECMAVIFEFLHSLIELRMPELVPLYPVFARLSQRWIQTDVVSSPALAIMRAIAIDPTVQDKTSLLEPIVMVLPIFMMMLNNGQNSEIPTHIEHSKKIGSLLQLLRVMVKEESMRIRIIEELKVEWICRVFVPLLGEDNSPRLRANDWNTCSNEAISLYVHAVALVNELARYDSNWIELQNSLSNNKQIHMVLAQSLFTSSVEVKSITLSMIGGIPIEGISDAMWRLQTVIQIDSPDTRKSTETVTGPSNDMHFPVLSVRQIARLDEVLDNLKNAMSSSTSPLPITTSDVMELYEYKLASMGHAERSAMASVEAASERCIHLQHRTAQLQAELTRLHQLLYHSQQCHEQGVRTLDLLKGQLRGQVQELTASLEVERSNYKTCSAQLKEVQQKLSISEEQNAKFKQVIGKLEESSTKLEKVVQKKEDTIKKHVANIDNLNLQIRDLQENLKITRSEYEKTMNELEEVTTELQTKRQILDTITKVATSQHKSK